MTPQDIAIKVSPVPGNGSVNLPSWNQTMGGKEMLEMAESARFRHLKHHQRLSM